MFDTLISIVLPVRNGENYIKEAIDSIIGQTYPHWELVVIDASDDNTPAIVKEYAKKDCRIKYFRQKSKGSVNGYNEALDECVIGEYVAFIHHDDIYKPEKLYEQLRMFSKYDDVDVVYNDIDFVDEKLNLIRFRGHEDFYHRTNDLLPNMMIGYGISNVGMNVLIRRDFIEKHHLRYSLETIVGCDHTYIFDLIDVGANFKHVNKSLLIYRVHEDNYSLDREAVERDFQKCYHRYSIEKLNEMVEKTNYSSLEKEIMLGKLYYRLNYINIAEEYFTKILDDHSNPWAAFYLGTGYYRYHGDFANAEKWLKFGCKDMPYSAEFVNNVGCSAYQTQGTEQAKPYFEKAVKIKPYYSDAKYNLEKIQNGEKLNPRLTAREIEHSDIFNVLWKGEEKKREESGSLKPVGNL